MNNQMMFKTILSFAVLLIFSTTNAICAEPVSTGKTTKKAVRARAAAEKRSPAATKLQATVALPEGWSNVNGEWVHSDGYKFVNGQILRTGTQTHKKPPKPPTKAEMEAALRKNTRPQTPAESAAAQNAAKEAQRKRNLVPRPAPQTGTHM